MLKQPAAGIEAAVEKFKDGIVEQVDSSLIEDWFNHLNWSQQDIDDEVEGMKENDSHSGFTTEISADWGNHSENLLQRDQPDQKRIPKGTRPDDAGRTLLPQLHKRNQYVLCLQLQHSLCS